MNRTERLKQKNSNRVVHERTKEEKEPTFLKRLTPFVIMILFGGLIYILFLSSAFNIKDVKIEGYSNPSLIQEIVDSHTANHYHRNNLILFDKKELEGAIKGDSGVRSIKIIKVYPSTLKIEVEQSVPKLIWVTGGESYEIDDRGYVIGKKENKNLPHVYDLLNIDTGLGERVASPTFINYITNVNDNFKSITGVEINKIIIYDLLSDVRVKSKDSWTVYLNASKDPISQLENLSRILTEAKESGHKRLKYIDMRLETRIFYK